jgi:hypothetical protein
MSKDEGKKARDRDEKLRRMRMRMALGSRVSQPPRDKQIRASQVMRKG